MSKKKEPPDYPGDEAIKQKFGEVMRELRLEKGLSIEEVDAFIDERMQEVDLVSHSGNSADGEFAHTLSVTDIHTGWTESVALLGKSQVAVQQALDTIKQALPFSLLGVDSDNGSEFINWHLKRWCEQNQIQLTRGRPYKKDDNAHVEQKNWIHVRKLLGWERYDTREAVAAINELYRKELRLWLNLYLPSSTGKKSSLGRELMPWRKKRHWTSPARTRIEKQQPWTQRSQLVKLRRVPHRRTTAATGAGDGR